MKGVERIECPFEQLLREAGYVQIYDGQTAVQKATEQFNLRPDERRFFVRHYRQVKNNHFVDKWAKLVYDMRTGWCTGCNIVRKTPDGTKHEQSMVSKVTTPKGA